MSATSWYQSYSLSKLGLNCQYISLNYEENERNKGCMSTIIVNPFYTHQGSFWKHGKIKTTIGGKRTTTFEDFDSSREVRSWWRWKKTSSRASVEVTTEKG